MTDSPSRSSKRQKGKDHETAPTSGVPTEKQETWVNLEKQPDDGNLTFDIPEDDNWTDQCIDFAVKTLTIEIMFNGQPVETTGVKDTPPAKGGELEATNGMFQQDVVAWVLNNQLISLVWIDERVGFMKCTSTWLHVPIKDSFVPVIRGCFRSRGSCCCQAVLRHHKSIPGRHSSSGFGTHEEDSFPCNGLLC
ncbi:hypothetical protein HanPSC8_Chr15g0660551 [Helianthus annuus]|nr:hypothetical protein HanPSC8_Chr15g0660551 [Helianthus annuus]